MAQGGVRGERRRGERGQAVVEFAVVLPLLVLLLLGIMEFGRVIHSLLTIQNAAREGARLGITPDTTDAEIEARVRQLADSLEGSADPARLRVEVAPAPAERTAGQNLTVTVRYDFSFILPWLAEMVPPDRRDGSYFRLDAAMTMRI